MVLAAMLDKVTRAYDLESKHPAIKYVGHEEVVRGIDYLPEKGLYITGELLFHHIAPPSPKQQGVCRLTVYHVATHLSSSKV